MCPAASRVGSDEVTTPLFPDKLLGSVYVLGQNPPNVQILVAASADGANVKLVGDVHLDEATGRLTATFKNIPDLAFSDFKLTFNGGSQAALVTPQACGAYESKAGLTPWSDPLESVLSRRVCFRSRRAPGVGRAHHLRFNPAFQAGTVVNQAGGFSPLSGRFRVGTATSTSVGCRSRRPRACGDPQRCGTLRRTTGRSGDVRRG